MAAAIPLLATAAATTFTAVMANQTTQHAKGAAEAQATANNAATLAQGPAPVNKPPTLSDSTLAAQADQRRKNALRAGMLSTIGTGSSPSTNTNAPPMAFGGGTKTTLG